MKHSKRSEYRRQMRKAVMEHYCDDNEVDVVKKQIDQAWKIREEEQKQEAARIQREIDCAWAEYALNTISEDNSELEEFLQDEDDSEVEEFLQDDSIEAEEQEYLYQKSKKRAVRRKATKRAKKRLIKKTKAAKENLRKRDQEELKNWEYHSGEMLKSRVARVDSLCRRTNRLQR